MTDQTPPVQSQSKQGEQRIAELEAENAQLRDQIRRLWWQCREQGCMANDWKQGEGRA